MNNTAVILPGNAPALLEGIPVGKQLWTIPVALLILVIGLTMHGP